MFKPIGRRVSTNAPSTSPYPTSPHLDHYSPSDFGTPTPIWSPTTTAHALIPPPAATRPSPLKPPSRTKRPAYSNTPFFFFSSTHRHVATAQNPRQNVFVEKNRRQTPVDTARFRHNLLFGRPFWARFPYGRRRRVYQACPEPRCTSQGQRLRRARRRHQAPVCPICMRATTRTASYNPGSITPWEAPISIHA